LPEPFETLLSTALVQFLVLRWESDMQEVVNRCNGVLRGHAPELGVPATLEREFADIAGIADLVLDGNYRQCPRLILSSRGGRFCSKACSNASFAARKARSEPRYFADKQERHRKRQKQQRQPTDRGAFVYID
jgi:hypothetical protein